MQREREFTDTQKNLCSFPLVCPSKTGTLFCVLWQTGFFFFFPAAIKSRKIPLGVKIPLGASPVCSPCTPSALGSSRGLRDGATEVLAPLQNARICKNSLPFTAGWAGDTARGAGRTGQGGGDSVCCSAQPFPGRGPQPALSIGHAQRGKNAARAPSHATAAVEFLEVAAVETLKVISLRNRWFAYSRFSFC